MTVEIGIIISLICCILTVVGFIIGQKKASKDDGFDLGKFMRRNKRKNSKHRKYDNRIKKWP